MTKDRKQPVSGDLMDEIFKNHHAKGDFDHLPGHGKPIPESYYEKDVFHEVLKEAKYLPPWLKLQHEIRDEIAQVIKRLKYLSPDQLHIRTDRINTKIKQYNRECPVPAQKGLIISDQIKEQYENWV
ncbi:DUF1992 domain-containing protein [Hazenella sp. IB182357]|uniref:DUF1992 domain-containing protein n=1 Tax=Polycladospora coralii TaxID=2771432 RepID=A0A926NAA1_9BACL|nr:DUF1992 domain-containing protein [Polycladospora coralii]MBD1373146.1 DUF1992 domain-containing protein [Polycladospora coralii]